MFRFLNIAAEELRLFVFQGYQALHRGKERQRGGAIAALDLDNEALNRERTSKILCLWLRSRLRKTPYWGRAHLLLGEHSLQRGENSLAFLSAKAALILLKGNGQAKGKALLARCYLKAGAFPQALGIFRELSELYPQVWSYQEDVAACLMADSKYSEAFDVLQRIPTDKISTPAQAALAFARGKLSSNGKSEVNDG